MARFGKDTVVRFLGGQIVFSVEGLDDSIIELRNYIKWSSNLSAPFQVFQRYWFDAIEDVFKTAGGPTPWPNLSDAYKDWKGSQYPTDAMTLSGGLRESLTNQTSSTIWHVGPRHIEFGTRVPHFIYHQEGLGNNPQRQTLVLPDSAAEKLKHLIEDYILTGRAR